MMRFGLTGRLVLLGAAVALLPGRAIAATAATMTIDASPQGALIGASQGKVKGNKGGPPAVQIALLSVSRGGSGADAATGAASGKRASQMISVTKAYDGNSARLEEAAATNEILREVTIVFETSAPSGRGGATGSSAKGSKVAPGNPRTAQVLVLKNAQISEIRQTRNIQEISIEYQSIEVTNAVGKPAMSDDWETP